MLSVDGGAPRDAHRGLSAPVNDVQRDHRVHLQHSNSASKPVRALHARARAFGARDPRPAQFACCALARVRAPGRTFAAPSPRASCIARTHPPGPSSRRLRAPLSPSTPQPACARRTRPLPTRRVDPSSARRRAAPATPSSFHAQVIAPHPRELGVRTHQLDTHAQPKAELGSSGAHYTTPVSSAPSSALQLAFSFDKAQGAHVLEDSAAGGGGNWSQRKSDADVPLTTASVTANCQWLGRCVRARRAVPRRLAPSQPLHRRALL